MTMLRIARKATDIWRRNTWPATKYARSLGVNVGSGCRLITKQFGTEPFLISIGNDVTISSNVSLLTHDGSTWLFRDSSGRRFDYRRIRIGNSVFIGAGSIIMPGVSIGDRVIVGAGSVVTKSIPSDYVVAGNPARKIGEYEELERRALEGYLSENDLSDIHSTNRRIRISKIATQSYRNNLL